METRCNHMSASSIAAFKSCPRKFQLAYVEGLRPAESTEALRVGTNWHALHEVYRNALVGLDHADIGGDDQKGELAMQAVLDHLNVAYTEKPASKTSVEWDLERQILLTCFVGYLWYYQEDPIEYLHQELKFRLPLYFPRTGLPLSSDEVLRTGKIDHVIRWHGMVGTIERKSTTRSIEPGGPFWERSQKDTQVSMYALALRDLPRYPHATDPKVFSLSPDGGGLIDANDTFGNTLYDVWRRPTIGPATLSQKDTAEFIESGTYKDAEFEVAVMWAGKPGEGEPLVKVDGETVLEVKVGAKAGTFAIRETVGMFSARLLNDIYERPDHYFQRKEIARTDKDLRAFQTSLFNIYQSQKHMAQTNTFFENENQCRATFPCPYIPICYSAGADSVIGTGVTPPGFRRIFQDLTVEGQSVVAGEE